MTETTVSVQRADLQKVLDIVTTALAHHEHRDQANAALHMTPVRYSPLTSSLATAEDRLMSLLDGIRDS